MDKVSSAGAERTEDTGIESYEDGWKNVKAGHWEQPISRGYLLKCCDCGLVHRMDFRVLKVHRNGRLATVQGARYVVQLRAYRDD